MLAILGCRRSGRTGAAARRQSRRLGVEGGRPGRASTNTHSFQSRKRICLPLDQVETSNCTNQKVFEPGSLLQ